MQSAKSRSAVARLTAVLVVIILVLAAIAAYAWVSPGAATTVTTTVSTGTATTVRTTVTTTVTSQGQFNQTLVDLAKQEGGSITIYGVGDPELWVRIWDNVNSTFPWMKVDYVGLSPPDIQQRATTEYQTGKVGADVVWDPPGAMHTMANAGILQSYSNMIETYTDYPASFLDPAGYLHPMTGNPVVLVYNTNLVTDTSTLPTSYLQLNESQWKGEVAMDNPAILNVAGMVFASLYSTVFNSNNATWTAWLNSVEANDPQMCICSSSDSYTAVQTGSAKIGLALLLDVASAPANSPVGYKILPPYYTILSGLGITKGAPHPYTAELFVQLMTSYFGQEGLGKAFDPPQFPPLLYQYFGNYLPPQVTFVPAGTPAFENPSGWSSYLSTIFPL